MTQSATEFTSEQAAAYREKLTQYIGPYYEPITTTLLFFPDDAAEFLKTQEYASAFNSSEDIWDTVTHHAEAVGLDGQTYSAGSTEELGYTASDLTELFRTIRRLRSGDELYPSMRQEEVRKIVQIANTNLEDLTERTEFRIKKLLEILTLLPEELQFLEFLTQSWVTLDANSAVIESLEEQNQLILKKIQKETSKYYAEPRTQKVETSQSSQ